MESNMKRRIAFALVMGTITTGVITFILIGFNFGFTKQFLVIWLRSWAIANGVAIPIILFIGPKIQDLVYFFIREKN
jgi:hypothetical protein